MHTLPCINDVFFSDYKSVASCDSEYYHLNWPHLLTMTVRLLPFPV